MARRKNKPATASEPLDFLEKLSPAERERLDEDVVRDHGISLPKTEEHVADPPVNFWDSISADAVAKTRPAKPELTLEEERSATDKVFEKFELRGRVAKLEEKLAKKPRQRLSSRERKIWGVIQRGSKGLTYCRELENAGVRPCRKGVWQDCPAGTYPAVYHLGESWPHRIQDEKSKIKRKAELAKTLASE